MMPPPLKSRRSTLDEGRERQQLLLLVIKNNLKQIRKLTLKILGTMQLRKTAVKPFLTPRHTSYGYLHNFHTALTTPAAEPWLNPNDFLKKI